MMDMGKFGFKDDSAASFPSGQGGSADGQGQETAPDDAVTEFNVPWLNDQGNLQIIRAYLC